MKALRFHRLARREISGTYLYYTGTDDPALAPDFQARLAVAFQEIQQHPTRFSRWNGTQARKYVLRRFPYVVFYIEHLEFVRILAVAHASRRPGYWRKRIAVD